MTKAVYKDKPFVVDILKKSFNDNKSVNYIIKQDNKREKRVKNLMEYSFNICYYYGEVYLSNDRKACALITLPEKKKMTFRSLFLDVKLLISCLGFRNINKVINREAKIKNLQPNGLLYYLWFIGVDPAEQCKGIGSALLADVIKYGVSKQRTICLETSTFTNIPWYEKFGFKIYNQLDLGYKLFFLKKE